jgi:hypothetical protein
VGHAVSPSGRSRELSAASPRLICGFPVPRVSADAGEKLPVLLEVAVAEELCAGAGMGSAIVNIVSESSRTSLNLRKRLFSHFF